MPPWSKVFFMPVAWASVLAQDFTKHPYEEGLRLANHGEWTQAIPALERAVEMEPRNPHYLKALGVALAKTDNSAAAAEPLGKACRIEPRLPDVCYYWARSLIVTSRFADALAALKTAGGAIPNGKRITLEAYALEGMDRWEEAEARYRQALTHRDYGAEARHRFGVFLYRQGRSNDALPLLEEAARLQPQSFEVAIELGRVYLQLDRLSDAERMFRQALLINPQDPTARLLLERAGRRRLPR